MTLDLIRGFSARETAASAFSAVRAMPHDRVIGRSMADTNAARRAAYQVAQRRIAAAVGTPKVLASEPNDDELDVMATVVAAELGRLDDTV